jgi:hypothetical protein
MEFFSHKIKIKNILFTQMKKTDFFCKIQTRYTITVTTTIKKVKHAKRTQNFMDNQ